MNAPIAHELLACRHFWTTVEDSLLREHYPMIHGVAKCCELLPHRSLGAIYARASSLGLKGVHYAAEHLKARKYSVEPWIDAEIRRIYEAKPERRAIVELAKRVSRPRWWVSRRALLLGLKLPRCKEPPWCMREEAMLRDIAHLHPIAIARKFKAAGFHRTETAVAVKRKRLRLDITDPDHYTAGQLASLMGVDRKTVTRWIEKEGLPACRRGTARNAQQGGDMWWIERKCLRRWVGTHAQLIDLRKVDRYWFIEVTCGVSP